MTKKSKQTTRQLLEIVLKNQQALLDHLQMIMYNQCPDGKQRFMVDAECLKKIVRKYNL